jgi:hypothetical protein
MLSAMPKAFDRLGRSLPDLITMLDDLRARGVKFHSLTEAIDAATLGREVWPKGKAHAGADSPRP